MAYKYSVKELVSLAEFELELYVYCTCEAAPMPENAEFGVVYGGERAYVYLKQEDEEKVQDLFIAYYKEHYIFNTSWIITYAISLSGKYGVFNLPECYTGSISLKSMVPIKYDEDVKDYSAVARRPYYQMRGKSVTEEQAFDIIRRTDAFQSKTVGVVAPDIVPSTNFNMWWLMNNHYPAHYGWVQPDGTVGINAITQKYPDIGEFVCEWAEYVDAFPYLDLVVLVTGCNEEVPEGWVFEASVEIGIWVHDRQVEFLAPKAALIKYAEYCEKYESKNLAKYEPGRCLANQGISVDIEEYKKRCFVVNVQKAKEKEAES